MKKHSKEKTRAKMGLIINNFITNGIQLGDKRIVVKSKQNSKEKIMGDKKELWDDAIKRGGWEKRFNDKFNQADKFLVFKYLPQENYSNAVWAVRDFLSQAIDRTREEALEEAGRAIRKRCLLEGCRYGIEGIDKEPLDRCIYCGEKRPESMPDVKENHEN